MKPPGLAAGNPEEAPTRRAFLATLAAAGAALLAGPLARAAAAATPRPKPTAAPRPSQKQFAEDRNGVRKNIAAVRKADLPQSAGPASVLDVRRLPGSGRKE